jgi:predicted ATPase
MTSLSISLLGSFQVRLRDKPVTGFETAKERALLAFLAVGAGQPQQRAMLAEMLWPGRPEGAARANLRHALARVRRAIGDDEAEPPYLLATRETVQFNRAGDAWVDVSAFTELGSEGIRGDSPNTGFLEEAVELYRGEFLEGFSLRDSAEFEEWTTLMREKYRRQVSDVLSSLAGIYEKSGEYEIALRHARRQVELEPWDERANRQLIRLLAKTGQRGTAMTQFESSRQAMEEELGIEPEEETLALYELIRDSTRPFAASAPIHHNLPAPVTPFVGREEELLEIRERLLDPACRLLTVTGPGGIGKTRLAIQAAGETKDTFPDGAWFVSLAAISSSEYVIPALASALKFSFYQDEEGDEPRGQLLDYLRRKEMLLVMDNLEHLLDGTGEGLLADILATAPQVMVLVTSRARLNVQGENLFHMGGLKTPAAETAAQWETADQAASYSALQLFAQRARQLRPNFKLTPENLVHVTRICQLVQGMPLGIELAAAWIGILPPGEIAVEIKGSLDFLKTESRGVPERLQSVRAVFNSSWNMLTEVEQDAFQKLSVFHGGFTRMGAQQVTGASLKALVGLVNKSLLRRKVGGRYEMHELLRGYALEQLQTNPSIWKAVRDRHSEHYATFLHERGQEMKGRGQKAAFDAVEIDIENVRAGWLWAVDQGRLDIIEKSLDGLYSFCTTHALSQELNALLENAVAILETVTSGPENRTIYAKLLTLRCWFYSGVFVTVPQECVKLVRRALALVREQSSERQMGLAFSLLSVLYAWNIEWEHGLQLLLDSVSYLRESGDKWSLAISLHFLGRSMHRIGEREKAKQFLGESVTISRQIGDRLNLARSLNGLGAVAADEQAYDQAISFGEESLEIFDAIGDRSGAAYCLQILGENSLKAGQHNKAIHFFKTARELCAEIGNRHGAGYMLSFEGLTARRMGDLERAREIWKRCRTLFQEIADENGIAWSLWEMGEIYRMSGDYEEARLWYKESLQLYQENQGDSFLDHRAKGDIALSLGDYTEAHQQFKRCLADTRARYRFGNVSYALNGLGRAAVGLGDFKLAHRHFIEALHTARDAGDRGVMIVALSGIAGWLAATGENERAVELATFVSGHQASWYETKNQAAGVLEDASARLPTEAAASAQRKGQTMELEELVFDFLGV